MVESASPFQFRLTPKNALIIFGANMVIAVFLTAIRFGDSFVVNTIYSQCIGFSISSGLHFALRRIRSTNLFFQIFVITIVISVTAVLGIAMASLVGLAVAGKEDQALTTDEKLAITLQSLLYSILFGSIITYIFLSNERISKEKIKRLEVEKKTVETELRFLHSQLEPHFLFNTLSNILGLIDNDPAKARRMLESFTSFLRASFLAARGTTVALSHEMDVVRNYLDMFAVRMGDRLRYEIHIPEDLREFRIPPLLIQPLVENAVKHGLEPAREGGTISIRAIRDGDSVRISVTDSGIGVNEKGKGAGIGLENINKRLNLAYGERGRLILEENKPSGVTVSIEIPYETSAGHHR